MLFLYHTTVGCGLPTAVHVNLRFCWYSVAVIRVSGKSVISGGSICYVKKKKKKEVKKKMRIIIVIAYIYNRGHK